MSRILWLEDDTYYVGKMLRSFEEHGDTCEKFETLFEFLEQKESIESDDLILLDLLVPTGSDSGSRYAGLDALKEISGLKARPNILVFSVVTQEDVLDEIRRYTPHILHKPVHLETFENKVASLLPQSSRLGSNNGRPDELPL